MVLFVMLAIFILIIVVCVVAAKKTSEKNKQFSEKLKALGFSESKRIESGGNILFVDDVTKKWCLKSGFESVPKIYNYSDLNEFEVYEDGESIAKGRMGSALVGGLLFGVVGAVVGGSRSKSIKNTCSVLQLRIRINDLNCPEKIINFITTKTKKDSILYKSNFETAKNMAATLSYIQNQVQKV